MDSVGPMAQAKNAVRPLPPEINFDPCAGTFNGTVAPHTLVIVESSVECCTYSSTADADGHWAIRLATPPKWYTTFRIFAKDPNSKAESEDVRFTFGGQRAKLSEVYASESVVFGVSTRGSDVAVYGPKGQLLGRSFVAGKAGAWSVTLGKKLTEGDKITVIATLPNGNTSLPHHATVERFSVDKRNIDHIAGSGARPSDLIQFHDAASKKKLAETQATPTGTWSHKFVTLLEPGTRIETTFLHMDASTTRGPVFTTMPEPCLAPAIDSVSGAQFGGFGQPGLLVAYSQLQGDTTVRRGTATVDSTGRWMTNDVNPAALNANDVLVATTHNADGTELSPTQATVILGQDRPNAPEVSYIDQSMATGVGDPGSYVLVSTVADGLICTTKVKQDGLWAAYWAPYVVEPLSTDTLVYFEMCETATPTDATPTSDYAIRYANILAPVIEKPVFTKYNCEEYKGTEATADTLVVVYNQDDSNLDINPAGGIVAANAWSLKPRDTASTPATGDMVYGVAYLLVNGARGPDSGKSTPVRSDSFDPPPPDVQTAYPDEVSGTEPLIGATALAEQPYITIYVAKATDRTKTPLGSSRITAAPALAWDMDFTASPLTEGEFLVAWAQTDAGNQSDEVLFQIKANVKPRPPVIGNWLSRDVSGSGAKGDVVSLSVNNIAAGTSATLTDTNWAIDAGRVPVNGDSLMAVETNPDGQVSDPFYILVGAGSTILTLTGLSRLEVKGNVRDANQTILGWRLSDGKQVINHNVASAGDFTAPYLAGSDIRDGDLISVSAQNTNANGNGSMTDYSTQYVPYP